MIGLSLPLAYLAGDLAPAAAAAWHKILGGATAGLRAARQAGVTSIELRSVGRDADPEAALAAAWRVWDAGLDLTIHGHLPAPACRAARAGIDPPLAPLLQALARHGAPCVMALHGYWSAGGTAEALAAMAAALRQAGIPLRIALENDRPQSGAAAGLSCEAVLGMIEQVGGLGIGACWDLGHAYAGVQQGRPDDNPSPAFLRRVIHTHIHDLGPQTHWPLTCKVVPLEPWLGLLFEAGYAGVLNLELSPERFLSQDVARQVFASIERLAAYLGRMRERQDST